MHVVICEDEPNIAEALKHKLTKKYDDLMIDIFTSGEKLMSAFKTIAGSGNKPLSASSRKKKCFCDLLILDVMMPVKDGFAVAKEVRRLDKRVPIIFLTAKSLEADKLKGFEIGADDYITKPFSMNELLARINATIRRSFDENKPENNIFNIGKFVFDHSRQTLTIDGEERHLTSKECELMRVFALNFNQIVDRTTTLQKIWKTDSIFAARSMDVYITKLRKYLSADPSLQIINVHGVGFKLTQQ